MEYLFRGKRVDGKGWVYGYLAQNQGHSWILIPQEGIAYQCFVWEEVIPETVGQFTGLTDKNGIKIFKDDIIFVGNLWNENAVIDYDEEISAFVAKFKKWGSKRIAKNTDMEIISNIHDNPELLEGIIIWKQLK